MDEFAPVSEMSRHNWITCLPIEICFTSVVKIESGFVLDKDERCLNYKLDVDRHNLCCFNTSEPKDACIKVCCDDSQKTISCPVDISVTKLVGCLHYNMQVKCFKKYVCACSSGPADFSDSESVSLNEVIGYSCSACPVSWDDICEHFNFDCCVDDIFIVAPCKAPVSLIECPGAIDLLKDPDGNKYVIFKCKLIVCEE